LYTKANSAANPLTPSHNAYGTCRSFVIEKRSVAGRNLCSTL